MKKIMFSERYGLEQAVLAGTKTMTRRVITIPEKWHGIEVYGFCHVKGQAALELTDGDGFCIEDHKTRQCAQILPTYRIGEEVAVAQKYQDLCDCDAFYDALAKSDPTFPLECIKYEKGCCNKMFVKAQWMPHRIRITDVKIERLQDISEEDCLREGIKKMEGGVPYRFDENGKIHLSADPRMLFADLIDRISGRGTWKKNPWVFVYEFELVR